MRSILYSLIILAVVLTVGSFFFRTQGNPTLLFLSGAGMKEPVAEIAANFEQETGIKVQTYFEGSSILRDYIINFNTGDIFLPGDKKNLDVLSKKGLVAESSFIAWHVVAILVSPGARERIKGLDDLADEGVRIAISNPQLASLGRIVMQQIIEKHPRGQDILKNVVVYGSSSQDVLRIYREGGIDAIIEWDVMAGTPEGEGLIVIPLEDSYQVKDELFAGLLTAAQDPVLARKFYVYLKTKGKEVFRKHGYKTEEL
ncbi:MAG: molybdate ABC transporter substrate-binding protein [Proteobacteria bacterium]|nr:molybdate ABC transporter substrate-binding protein [Pseudomonadota bacterium]MBU1708758.1 molybdate ABC transporter substrate-binding protein [Pseudomonadota bacterium]